MASQSIEDFEKEYAASQYDENVRRAALTTAQPKKHKKPDLTAIDIQLEQDAMNEIGGVNWVGRLHEYRQAHHVSEPGIAYRDDMSGTYSTPRATSSVVIAETPDSFGSGVWFSNKKSARQYAAKKAIDWLIANEKMPADGSVSFPSEPIVTTTPTSVTVTPGETVASLVPDLAHRLGFNVPTYRINAQTPGVPLYDGWAEFNDPRIDGHVGKISNVHGKKNTRDMIAKEVYAFLKDIERQRMAAAAA